MKAFKFIFIPALCLLASCSTPSVKKAVETTPTPGYQVYSSGSFNLRPLKEITLPNGLKVVFIYDSTLPRVSLTLLVKTGVLQDPRGKEGLNALTAYMLEQGTQSQPALKLADAFGQLGTELAITPGADFTLLFADSLSTSRDRLLSLFADVAMNPAFTDAEIARIKSQMLAGLQRKTDDPSNFADDKIEELLYGPNPYGEETNGNIASVKKLRKQDVIRHYLTYYRPNNASLAVVGKYDADFENKVRAAFADWSMRTIPQPKTPAIPSVEGLKVDLLTKRNLQQAQIRLAQVGIQRQDPDFLKLRVANEILGGGFSSRLNQHVRDDLGLTYSIYSYFDSRAAGGSFEISTFTKNDTVGRTLDETLKVVANYVKEGANEKELDAAKNLLIGQFPRAIETADKTAFNVLALDFYGIPLTYLTDYNKNIEKISLKDVNEVIKKHLTGDNFKILVYADPKVAPQLKDYKVDRNQVH